VAAGVRRHSAGRGADQVILTIVNQATMSLALSAVREGGVLVLFGAKPDACFPLDCWQLWRREINVVSSYSSTPELLPRALAILGRNSYALEQTVSHILPLAEAAHGFQLVHDGQASKVVICRE
jgi:L-iditol 2-dehydrogenase